MSRQLGLFRRLVNVLFPEEAVRYTGQMTTLRLTADSGNIVERGFCPTCGSPVYLTFAAMPETSSTHATSSTRSCGSP